MLRIPVGLELLVRIGVRAVARLLHHLLAHRRRVTGGHDLAELVEDVRGHDLRGEQARDGLGACGRVGGRLLHLDVAHELGVLAGDLLIERRDRLALVGEVRPARPIDDEEHAERRHGERAEAHDHLATAGLGDALRLALRE